MADRGRSAGVIARYALFQAPEIAVVALILWALYRWLDLPAWLAFTLGGVWVLKDILLYPWVWKAYDWSDTDGVNPLVGADAVVTRRLDPSGQVRVGAELWRAEVSEGAEPLEPGERVRVNAIHGLILRVEPAED